MKNLTFAQSFSLAALNAQDSLHMTTVKKISLRCITAAIVLEAYFDGRLIRTAQGALVLSGNCGSTQALYEQVVLNLILSKKRSAAGDLMWWLTTALGFSARQLKKIEHTMADSLKGADLIEEIPNLLGCDMFYNTAGVSIKEYRSRAQEYTAVLENFRAETLEAGPVSDETIAMLWLSRESGCLHDVFSKSELELVAGRMAELFLSIPLAKTIFSCVLHRGVERAVKEFLNAKKNMFQSETGTGVNFIFPILERSQSVFIDIEAWFSNPAQRLADVEARLTAKGHLYTVIREGVVPLIKVDNILYEAVPTAIRGRIPIQGIRLRRYPL